MLFEHKQAAATPDLANLKITDAKLGDVLSVTGAGTDFNDLDFTIDRVDQLESGSRRWVELSGPWQERRVHLEVHGLEVQTGVVEVFGNFDGRKLTLDEIGLSEQDLADLDSRQNPNDFVDYDGKFWLYRSSREIGVFSAGNTTGIGFYAWQFQEQDGRRFLNIRKYQGESFSGSIWTRTEPADITVYRGA
ncbi:MAG: hypothetical protein M3Y72_05020 [Acidobacteriota bacterium]|nr:hypothetical protein [Acidobacteriota bacterium]